MSRVSLFVLPILLASAGCSGYVQERVVVRGPPPREVYFEDAPRLLGGSTPEPPPARVEVITARPGPGYAWNHGRWARHGREWVWVGGHWHRG